jgi:hypothetical protein
MDFFFTKNHSKSKHKWKLSKSSVTSINIYWGFHSEEEETVLVGKEVFESQDLRRLNPAGHTRGLLVTHKHFITW